MVCESQKLRSLSVNRRGEFFEDPFFRDAWSDYSHAVRRIVDRFNQGFFSTSERMRDSHYHSMYRTLRSARLNYSSHSAKFKDEGQFYRLVMDVREFMGGEITVRTAGRTVSVRGRVELGGTPGEDAPGEGSSSATRTLHRRFSLPPDADCEKVESSLSRDAVLTITIPKKTNVRVIPVHLEDDASEDAAVMASSLPSKGKSTKSTKSRGGVKRQSVSAPEPGPRPSKRTQEEPRGNDGTLLKSDGREALRSSERTKKSDGISPTSTLEKEDDAGSVQGPGLEGAAGAPAASQDARGRRRLRSDGCQGERKYEDIREVNIPIRFPQDVRQEAFKTEPKSTAKVHDVKITKVSKGEDLLNCEQLLDEKSDKTPGRKYPKRTSLLESEEQACPSNKKNKLYKNKENYSEGVSQVKDHEGDSHCVTQLDSERRHCRHKEVRNEAGSLEKRPEDATVRKYSCLPSDTEPTSFSTPSKPTEFPSSSDRRKNGSPEARGVLSEVRDNVGSEKSPQINISNEETEAHLRRKGNFTQELKSTGEAEKASASCGKAGGLGDTEDTLKKNVTTDLSEKSDREVPVEKRQSLLEDDIFEACWNDFRDTLQEVLTRLQELSAELGQSRVLPVTPDETASKNFPTTKVSTGLEHLTKGGCEQAGVSESVGGSVGGEAPTAPTATEGDLSARPGRADLSIYTQPTHSLCSGGGTSVKIHDGPQIQAGIQQLSQTPSDVSQQNKSLHQLTAETAVTKHQHLSTPQELQEVLATVKSAEANELAERSQETKSSVASRVGTPLYSGTAGLNIPSDTDQTTPIVPAHPWRANDQRRTAQRPESFSENSKQREGSLIKNSSDCAQSKENRPSRPTSLGVPYEYKGTLLPSLRKDYPVEAWQENYLNRLTPASASNANVHFIPLDVEPKEEVPQNASGSEDLNLNVGGCTELCSGYRPPSPEGRSGGTFTPNILGGHASDVQKSPDSESSAKQSYTSSSAAIKDCGRIFVTGANKNTTQETTHLRDSVDFDDSVGSSSEGGGFQGKIRPKDSHATPTEILNGHSKGNKEIQLHLPESLTVVNNLDKNSFVRTEVSPCSVNFEPNIAFRDLPESYVAIKEPPTNDKCELLTKLSEQPQKTASDVNPGRSAPSVSVTEIPERNGTSLTTKARQNNKNDVTNYEETRPAPVTRTEIQSNDVMFGSRLSEPTGHRRSVHNEPVGSVRLGHREASSTQGIDVSESDHGNRPRVRCGGWTTAPQRDMGGLLFRGREKDSDSGQSTSGSPQVAPIPPSSLLVSRAVREKQNPPEEKVLPPYVRQRSEASKRHVGFSHVSSDNVRRLRDVWASKQETSNPQKTPPAPTRNTRSSHGSRHLSESSVLSPEAKRDIGTAATSRQANQQSLQGTRTTVSRETPSATSTSSMSQSYVAPVTSSPDTRKVSLSSIISPATTSSSAIPAASVKETSDSAAKDKLASEETARNVSSSKPSSPGTKGSSTVTPQEECSKASASKRRHSPEFSATSQAAQSAAASTSEEKEPAHASQPPLDKYRLGQQPTTCLSFSTATTTTSAATASSTARQKDVLSPPCNASSPSSARQGQSKVHQKLFRRLRDSSLLPTSEAICFKEEEDRYKMVMDVEEFVPGEIEVLQEDKLLTVKGTVKVEDASGYVSIKTFNRKFNIPRNSREEDIDSALSKDGILTIFVPKKRERIIEIQLVD